MKLAALALLILSFASVANAESWKFRNGNWWWGNQAYSVARYRDGSCGCYRWRYTKIYPASTSSSVVTHNTDNSITVTNHYPAYQPTAQGGSTAYGYFANASYSDLNLATLLVEHSRSIQQGQQGMLALGNQFGGLLGNVASIENSRTETAKILATGEAASRIAIAVQPPPGPPVSVQSNQVYQSYQGGGGGTTNGQYGQSGGRGIEGFSPLVAQHCASCHSQSGGAARADAIQHFNMDRDDFGYPTRADGIIAAGKAITSDDPAKRMPLGIDIQDQTRGALIQDFLHLQ